MTTLLFVNWLLYIEPLTLNEPDTVVPLLTNNEPVTVVLPLICKFCLPNILPSTVKSGLAPLI
jgi:hypothetical protein